MHRLTTLLLAIVLAIPSTAAELDFRYVGESSAAAVQDFEAKVAARRPQVELPDWLKGKP